MIYDIGHFKNSVIYVIMCDVYSSIIKYRHYIENLNVGIFFFLKMYKHTHNTYNT